MGVAELRERAAELEQISALLAAAGSGRGQLCVVEGPSGVGKSTVVARLLRDGGLPLHRAVTVTTRQKRPGEIDDVDYHFWTRERFQPHRL